MPDDALKSCMECGADFPSRGEGTTVGTAAGSCARPAVQKKIPIPKLLESKAVRVCNLCLKAVVSPCSRDRRTREELDDRRTQKYSKNINRYVCNRIMYS